MQEFLNKLVQIFHLKRYYILQTLITLVQLARALDVLRNLLVPFDVVVGKFIRIKILRCAVFLIEHALNEPCREELVRTAHQRCFLLVTMLLVIVGVFTALFLLQKVELLVDQSLLALNVAKHVLALGQADEIGKDLRVFLVELAEFGQADVRLLVALVEALEELVDVVENEIVLKDAHHVRLLIVDQVIDNF